jgi:hypothetical protein
MERRRQTPGWTRGHSVAIGRHHPSDVLAGAYSMAILLANPEVQAVDPAQQIQLIDPVDNQRCDRLTPTTGARARLGSGPNGDG